MKSNSKMFNHSAQIMDGGSNESILYEHESEKIDESNLSSKDDDLDEEIRLAEEEDEDGGDGIETIKTNFNSRKIHDHIQPSMNNSYFKVEDQFCHQKFIHKQIACWLLTDRNNHLSNDRLSRVIQKSRK